MGCVNVDSIKTFVAKIILLYPLSKEIKVCQGGKKYQCEPFVRSFVRPSVCLSACLFVCLFVHSLVVHSLIHSLIY